MSTIKSSDEHLTLNADGSSKDIKFQANGVEKASISSAGAFTSTTIDATKLTGNLPAISAASLTNVPAANITGTLPAISGANLTNLPSSISTGQIVQQVSNSPNTGLVSMGTSTWTEVHSGLRTTITPSYSNSIILIEVIFFFGGHDDGTISHFKLYNHTDSADINLDTAGNRQGVHGSQRMVDTDANDVHMVNVIARTTASNTNARAYTLYHKNESSSNTKTFFAHESDTSALAYAKPVMIVTEIKA